MLNKFDHFMDVIRWYYSKHAYHILEFVGKFCLCMFPYVRFYDVHLVHFKILLKYVSFRPVFLLPFVFVPYCSLFLFYRLSSELYRF